MLTWNNLKQLIAELINVVNFVINVVIENIVNVINNLVVNIVKIKDDIWGLISNIYNKINDSNDIYLEIWLYKAKPLLQVLLKNVDSTA